MPIKFIGTQKEKEKIMSWTESLSRILYQIPNKPSRVQMEVNNACNLDCVMCPRHELPVELEEMDTTVFKASIDQICKFGIKQVDIGGWGEVTYHKDFVEIIRYATAKGLEISMTTNGLLLKKEKLQVLLDEGVKNLTFSIDSLERRKGDFSGHINSPSIKNLERILSFKAEYELNIKVNTLIQKANKHETLELLDFMSNLGVDMVVLFGPNVARDNEQLRIPYSAEYKLYSYIEEQATSKRWNCIVTTPLGRYRAGLRKYYFQQGSKCPQTWESIYLNRHGQVTPCTLLPDLVIAELDEYDSLEELWTSKKFKDFRRNQEVICNGCDALKFKPHDAGAHQ